MHTTVIYIYIYISEYHKYWEFIENIYLSIFSVNFITLQHKQVGAYLKQVIVTLLVCLYENLMHLNLVNKRNCTTS